MRRLWSPALLLVGSTALAAASDMGTEQQREAGRVLYDQYCAQCHGVAGDGAGIATGRVKPAPRDFTSGKYKFRTTPSGMLPTDADLRRAIRQGLPYTSMPGWPSFGDQEVQNIIYHLKSFSPNFSNPDKQAQPIEIPPPPVITPESIDRGRAVYESQGCAACHGNLGRGDGPSAPTLTDDWGDHIRPADMTMRWTFRGGPTRRDVFRTFSTGLNGTPMPSYADSLEVADRWDLVNYIDSLGDGDSPRYSNLLLVSYVEDEIDLAAGEELFAAAPMARFPLVGQVIEPGRSFYPSTTSVEVRAVHNRKEIAFLIRWNDMSAETSGINGPQLEVPPWEAQQPGGAVEGGEEDFWGEAAAAEGDDFWGEQAVAEDDFWGEGDAAGAGKAESGFADAVALQFPATLPTGIRKPYFIFGDAQSPVDLWFVDLVREVCRLYAARGSASIGPPRQSEIEVVSGYDEGRWSVMLKRDLRARNGISFEEGQFVPVSFSVWDGFNEERGNKRALSQWFHLHLEPSVRVSAVGPMVRVGLGALLLELLLIFVIRRRHRRERPAAGVAGVAAAAGTGAR